MIRDILSIRAGECRFCITDDTPFFFCGDPVQPESSYCPEHHAVCHNGYGREVAALEAMIRKHDGNIVRTRGPDKAKMPSLQHNLHHAEGNTAAVPVDVQIRGRE
jgi:hypothetical protein